MNPTERLHRQLRKINSLTKYPSIPTYHKLGKKGLLLEERNDEFEGLSVVATEKVDGCVPSNALISMADGSRKKISRVVVGDEVLGVDKTGTVTTTKVLSKFKNGQADTWLKITGKRTGAGRGSHFFALRCTPEHRIYVAGRKDYAKAEELKPGDSIVMARSEMGLTPIQEQVLLGKLLGDGSFASTEWSAHIAWSHAKKDAEYVHWTARALGGLASPTVNEAVSGYGTDMIRRRTMNSAWIKEKFGSFFSADRDKKVPSWVADELTPLALAFWYMDDGSLSHGDNQEDRAYFSVCGFTEKDCDVLIRALSKYGIEATYFESKGYPYLRLDSNSAERLFLLVAPYVPPRMQRKLPLRYRGHQGWLPSIEREYKPALVEQIVEKIEVDPAVRSLRFDMETSTHNYFAHGVLVHNCNSRIVLLPSGRYLIGSREEFLHAEGDLIHNPVLGIVDALRSVAERFNGSFFRRVAPDAIVCLYLEVYGGHKITKASKQYSSNGVTGCRLFDLSTLTPDSQTFERTLEQIAGWRERGGQTFFDESQLQAISADSGVKLTPRIPIEVDRIPTGINDTWDWLATMTPKTRVALDEGAKGNAEGLVLRSRDRQAIAKLRLEDYARHAARSITEAPQR